MSPSVTTDAEELRDLRGALHDALAVPTGDVPPEPDPDWRAGWARLAGLGVTAFTAPEETGGLGHRVDAAAVAATALGAALHGAPYAGLVAGLAAIGTDDEELVADAVAGDRVIGFGVLDAGGTARGVLGGGALDALVLSDRASGEYLLAADPSTWTAGPAIASTDPTRTVGDLAVDRDACRPLSPTAADPLTLHRLLLAADTLGGVERSLERAVAYCAGRTAFGTVTGAFQAVQHRLVDHTIRVRGMGLAITEAAARATTGDAGATRAALVAEVAVAAHAVHVLHDLLQLTGGIGFTWEHGLHLFERRAHTNAQLAQNPRRATLELAGVEGWAG